LLRLPGLLTANTFKTGHRLRIYVMSAFAPNYARNLQTGASETSSSRMQSARITIHHDARHPSRLIIPVIPRGTLSFLDSLPLARNDKPLAEKRHGH
jgi:predicted acyl esterase